MSMFHQAILWTSRIPFLLRAYRSYYELALVVASRSLGGIEGVISIPLRRGMLGGEWRPGFSDIDLTVVTKALTPPEELDFLRRYNRRLHWLRILFPMLSIAVMDDRQLTLWSEWGSLQRLEMDLWKECLAD